MKTFFLPLMPLAAALLSVADAAFAANPDGVGTGGRNLAVKKFSVAEGLEVSLFACEPMVRNPTDMDIDERGRVWVTEGVNYRSTFSKWGILQTRGRPHRDSGRHQSRRCRR